jgi:drug/metabolite transporter (DMT)-like permease
MIINISLIIFVIITWGYSWILMKSGLKYIDPFTFSTIRCGVGALTLLPFLILKGFKIPNRREFLDISIVGVFQTSLMFGFLLFGMQYITAGKSAVLLYTMPVWTSLYVHCYLKQKLNLIKWIGVLMGTLGILFILGWDNITHQDESILKGEVLIIIAAICWATSNIWVKKNLYKQDPFVVNTLQLIVGTLGLMLFTLMAKGNFNFIWNKEIIFILLFTGIVASALNFTIWFQILKKVDINIATFSSMLVPVCSLLLDWTLMNNTLDTGLITGGVFILSGIYLVSRKKRLSTVRHLKTRNST